jgi:dihydrofolate reductase
LQRGVVSEEMDTRRKLSVGYAKRGWFTTIPYPHPGVRHPWFVVLHDVDVTVLVTSTCQNGDHANQQGKMMGHVIVGMTVSLDGCIQDRHGSVGALYPDLATLRTTEPMQEVIQNTGAVVMGWNAFAMANDPDVYAGNYEFQVAIFVLTHTVPPRHPKETDQLSFTFVTGGIERAVQQAKAAAGRKDVTVIGGAKTVQQCLNAGIVDELHLDMMPVLLGSGLRLFEAIATE